MPETKCYAMVRGSAIRVTGLGDKGSIPDTIQYAVSKSVAKVTINEVTESGSDEFLESAENDNDKRLRLQRPEQTLYYTVDIDFLRVDPGIFHLIAGVPLVRKELAGFGRAPFGTSAFGGDSLLGFGEMAFGEDPFGLEEDDLGTVIGFDAATRLPPASFALEVWSKLAGAACADGTRQYGYTLFPYLRGGRMTGFEFKSGLVSFSIVGAKTRKNPRWGLGPYDLEGPYERLLESVSRNTMFRQMLTSAIPPMEMSGIQETTDVLDGGTATLTSDDVLDGGTAADAGIWAVEGGRAL